jgi:uncharacterized protein YjiK
MKNLSDLFFALITIALFAFTGQRSEKVAELIGRQDTTIIITQEWKLPASLREISGITCLDENRLACIQDEKGVLFIYNLIYDSVEKEIPFAGNFDFEGITLVGKTIYAIRSNGILYSIKNYNSGPPTVAEIKTWLTVKQNAEGLCYDQKRNRLLIAIKGGDPAGEDYKGIYAYDLRTQRLNRKPILKINFNDPVWNNTGHKMQPSDLAINPLTGDIYIIDGEIPSLLIMSSNGEHKKLYHLDTKDFHLPEGIAFSKTGQLFICNEGGLLGKGNIVEIVLNDTLPATNTTFR